MLVQGLLLNAATIGLIITLCYHDLGHKRTLAFLSEYV